MRYSPDVIGTQVHDLSQETLANLPVGVDGTDYQWVDLDGEGLSGILARQGGAWYYKHNLGEGRFAPPQMLTTQPATAGRESRQQLLDLAGDGHLDLAELGGPMPGCYRRTEAGGWQPFRPFQSCPNISWDDPDLRMVDLDGDGLADVLITGDDAFTWYPSLGLDGFGDWRRAFSANPWSEERGPRLMLADPEQTIYLADMSGDGLSDLVRVRNGEVCYWPNLGFGRFGAKVTMDRQPVARRARAVRPAARPAGRRRRHRLRGPHLPAPRRNPGVPQPVRQRLRRPARATAGIPATGQPGARHGGRPARPRHRLPGLVLAAARG